MTVSDALKAYLEASVAGGDAATQETDLAKAADELFASLQRSREKYDLEWYLNRSFMDGDHWVRQVVGKHATPTTTRVDANDEDKRIKRTANLTKAWVRGVKNLVLKVPVTVEISPEDETPEALDEAKKQTDAWRAIENEVGLDRIKRDVVGDGFEKYSGYIVVLPVKGKLPQAEYYDGFDVFLDPTAPHYQKGHCVAIATPQNVQDLKANAAYRNTEELKGDGKRAASDLKNVYENDRLGGQAPADDLATTILMQLFLRAPYSVRENQVVPLTDGQTRIWIITTAEGKHLRCEETALSRFPLVRYIPEKRGHGAYGPAWLNDIRPLNKAINTLISKGEEWHIKAVPKLMVPSDSKLKEVTNVTAEVLEYNKQVGGDAIKDFIPGGLPASYFTLIDRLLGFLSDVGGLHEASRGIVPAGVKSGKGIELLQAGDAESNMAEPLANWGETVKEVAEMVLEQIAENATEPTKVQTPDGDGRSYMVVGEAGTKAEDGSPLSLPPGTLVVKPSKVKVNVVPSVAYSEAGRREVMAEMYKDGAIDRKTYLESFRLTNAAQVAETARKEEMEKAKTPPPPPPVPADKLMQGLAALTKSGQPITIEQLQAVMEQAGLPVADAEPELEPVTAGAPLDAAAEQVTY